MEHLLAGPGLTRTKRCSFRAFAAARSRLVLGPPGLRHCVQQLGRCFYICNIAYLRAQALFKSRPAPNRPFKRSIGGYCPHKLNPPVTADTECIGFVRLLERRIHPRPLQQE
jgi:hypothetical protein